jgi:hypothetical protein
MSAAQTVFGSLTFNRRCTRSSAQGWAWSLLVVPLSFVRSLPVNPAAVIQRATRRREQGFPCSRRSAWILGMPSRPLLMA